MVVNIELNQTKEVIWSVPESKILLTSETPTASVDLAQCSDYQKRVIALGIMTGKIASDAPIGDVYTVKTKPLATQAQPTVTLSDRAKSASDQLVMQCKEMLSLSAGEIKKEILISKDIRMLKMLLVLEQGARKRASVISALQAKSQQIEAAVQASLDTVTERPEPVTDPSSVVYKGQTVSYSVVESKEDNVEVEIPGISK